MRYRNFKLKNSLDQTYELTDQNFKRFFNSPKGLGFKKNITGIRIGNRFKTTKREYEFPQPSGELLFYDYNNEQTYDSYSEFIRFASFYPLRLYYYTPSFDKTEDEANSLYLKCEIIVGDKTEISRNDNALHVPITFKGSSFWMSGRESNYIVDLDNIGDSEFTFPLSFPFSFGTDPLRNIVLSNNGTLPAPVTFVITGSCTNPYIRLYDKDYVEYGSSKIIGTYDYVKVSAEEDDEQIILENNGIAVPNAINKQDLTIGNEIIDDYYLTFLKLKPGMTYATVNFENNFTGTISLSWRDEYISY